MELQQPLYTQLKETIISLIANGEYTPGDRLPSQREMCEQYHMSHMTVRHAINELINEGVIYSIAGKGLYVAQVKQPFEMGSFVSHKEHMKRLGMVPSTLLIDARIVSASTILAQLFGIDVCAPLVYLKRLRMGNGKPISILASHLPHQLCDGILEHDLESGSLFGALRNTYGLNLSASTSAIEAVLANTEQADLLELTLPAALLLKEQITYLDTGQAIEFSRSFVVPGYHVRVEEGKTTANQVHFSMHTLSGDRKDN